MKLSKLSLALFCVSPVVGMAQTSSHSLADINVVALRDNITYTKASYDMVNLNKEALLTQHGMSVADTLKYINGIDIQGGARSIAQKPNIRGLSGNRVVQVIDGVRQNFDLAHRGSYFLPLSQIQALEVVKGPSSTLWGSGALGGVVAMRTANALDLLKNNDQFGLHVNQGYQSVNGLSETALSAFAANEKVDALISAFYNKANNLRFGKQGTLPHSAYTQTGGMAKLGWQFNDTHRLELSHRTSLFQQTAPGNNEAITELTAQTILNEIARSRNYANLTSRLGSSSYLSKQKIVDQSSALNYYINPADNPYLNTQFTIYRNSTKETEKRVISGLDDKTKLITTGVNAHNSTDLGGLALTYGIDMVIDKADTARGTNNDDGKFRPAPYQAKAKTTGIYLLTHVPILNDTLVFSPSIRYDHFDTRSQHTRYKSTHWSPAAALTWKSTPWLDLTARYTEAFRAPSMQERFVSGAHFGTNIRGLDVVNRFKANPNLKPETAKNKELSAKFHFFELFTDSDKLSFNATYFQNDVKDFIHLRVFKENPADRQEFMPKVSQYQNVSNARLTGIELETAYQTDRITLTAGYAQTRGIDKINKSALSGIAADKFSFAIDYAIVKDKFNIGTLVALYRDQNRVPKDAETYQGYTLTNIYATYAPKQGEWKNLRLDVAIDNLFDKKYQPAFSLMEGPGRNVKVNLGYYF
ncbi:MAG: TonB-dependent hemoglobin/transferrin/lactoferrin family receptor [Pasteurellaceae bacterium]|nr:TonB-dependent hemoglobin/transferrin/lactoferrin family receptor [Pasteurellaceae bacterium]